MSLILAFLCHLCCITGETAHYCVHLAFSTGVVLWICWPEKECTILPLYSCLTLDARGRFTPHTVSLAVITKLTDRQAGCSCRFPSTNPRIHCQTPLQYPTTILHYPTAVPYCGTLLQDDSTTVPCYGTTLPYSHTLLQYDSTLVQYPACSSTLLQHYKYSNTLLQYPNERLNHSIIVPYYCTMGLGSCAMQQLRDWRDMQVFTTLLF